jgi:DNA polymerase (family 10)
MDNHFLARVLHEIADILEIKGENPFRIRSYRLAAESVESSDRDVAALLARGEALTGLPGVGAGIASTMAEIVREGSCAYHRELLDEVPRGVLELLELPGLGHKSVRRIWTGLGVRSPQELEAAIDDGRFLSLPGMKEKKAAGLKRALAERSKAVARRAPTV